MSEQDDLRSLRELIAQLTERVYRLEQRLDARPEPPAAAQPSIAQAARRETPMQSLASLPEGEQSTGRKQPRALHPEMDSDPQPYSLERRIGSQWLNRVGVIAVLIGVSYFLKLAFDNGWVGPGIRVLIGCIAGAGLCWWSERFRRSNSLAFSYSLKAIGAGILYLSLWASFQLYHVLPGAIAFIAMVLVTAATAGIAVVEDAELLAGLALIGGLLPPVLCGTHQNREAALFCYLLLLSCGAFVLQRVKPWPRILLGAFVGSFLLGAAWFNSYYDDSQFGESLLLFTLLFAIFAVAPLYAILEPERDRTTRQTGLLLAILNAAAYFAAVYSQLETSANAVQTRASAYALGLAIVYAALAIALERRVAEHPGVERLLPLAHYGLAISFFTIGIALRLHQHWITLAWLLEGALIFWAGASTARRRLKLLASVVVALGVVRLLTLDLHNWGVQPLIFNARFFTFAVAVGALLWMLSLSSHREESEVVRMVLVAAAVLVNLLALLAAGLEIHDAFELQRRASNAMPMELHSLRILCNFSYSALIMIYGAGLMWMGFSRKSALLRWQAILLIAATAIKVFFFDISALDHGWRVLSFIILGVLLLVVSYAYQRDWLGIQRPHSN